MANSSALPRSFIEEEATKHFAFWILFSAASVKG
jgi:hypothetical protein